MQDRRAHWKNPRGCFKAYQTDETGVTPWVKVLFSGWGDSLFNFGFNLWGYGIFSPPPYMGFEFKNWNWPLESLLSFYSWENKVSEVFPDLPKATQLVSGETMLKTRLLANEVARWQPSLFLSRRKGCFFALLLIMKWKRCFGSRNRMGLCCG